MDGFGTPDSLKDERMGHFDGSVQARYSHVTVEMRERLMGDLTSLWNAALGERRALSPGSPVAVLDRLLKSAAELLDDRQSQDRLPDFSQIGS